MGRHYLITFDGQSSQWCAERLSYYIKKINYWQPIEHIKLTPFGGKDRALSQSKDFEAIKQRQWFEKSFVIVFDEKGLSWDSMKWAKQLASWAQYPHLCFVIGPAYGLDRRWLEKASLVLSLSQLTLNHELAQVLVAEQIYRAWTIEKNWPYHQD